MKVLMMIVLIYLEVLANDYIKVDLVSLADRVSKQINKNIYLDEDLNTTVSLFIPEKIDDKDLLNVFKKSLSKQGYYLSLSGNTYYLYSKNVPLLESSYLFQLKYNSFKDASDLLSSINVKFKYLNDTNSLLLTCSKKKYKQIKQLLSQIDKKQDQVILKIMIFEYTDNISKELGVQFGSIYKDIQGTTKTALNSIIATVSTSGINLTSTSFYAALKLLDSNEMITVKQFPFIVAKNNQNFAFSAVTNVPYLVSTTTTEATNTSEQNSIEYKDVGLQINGKTLIHENYITLDLDLLLQDFLDNTVTETPRTYKRTLKSNTNISFNNVLIISGLKRVKHNINDYSIPFFSNIPYIGKAFKYESKSNETMNITIAIQVIKSDCASVVISRRMSE